MDKTRFLSQVALFLAVMILSQAVYAGFIDDQLGQSEADAAKQFEKDFPAFLSKNLKNTGILPPQTHLKISKKVTKRVQFVSEKDGEYTWQEVARTGWYKEYNRSSYKPYWGKSYKRKLKDIPADSIVELLDLRFHRDINDHLRMACWLYSKGMKMDANNLIGKLAEYKAVLRPKLEAWVCEKHGWTLPENGLMMKPVFDFDNMNHGRNLITQEAFDEQKKARDKKSKEIFKRLTDLVGSTKGEPGRRKGSPKMRLELLQEQLQAFRAVYADLDLVVKKANAKKLDALIKKVDDDLKFIVEQSLACERLDLDAKDITGDFEKAGKAWSMLLLVDPNNPVLLMKTTYSHQRAAKVERQQDGKLKASNPAFAASCARHYETMIATFPSILSYRVSAGFVYASQGGKGVGICKKYCQFVIDKVNAMKAPDERAKKDKADAEKLLKDIK
ncbi:MAG: hypothetical protein ACYTDT_05060 [Planctomycetota bacterium]|jgi:hypothetical protein